MITVSLKKLEKGEVFSGIKDYCSDNISSCKEFSEEFQSLFYVTTQHKVTLTWMYMLQIKFFSMKSSPSILKLFYS